METLPGFEAYTTDEHNTVFASTNYNREINLIDELLSNLDYEEANKIAVELVKKYPSTETYHKMLQELSNDWAK